MKAELSPRMEGLYAAVARAVGEVFPEDDAAGQIIGQQTLAAVWPIVEHIASERDRLLGLIVGLYEEAIEGG